MWNLVACTSFLVELKLVKACLADKDVEALVYHKLLVEEKESIQKRQAALLEKKRQKKLSQNSKAATGKRANQLRNRALWKTALLLHQPQAQY